MTASPATSTVLALEMRGVSVSAMRDPAVLVAEDVNWSVAPGDFWVIGGWQGAGKSDFLMLAAGLTSPLSGQYSLFGQEMPLFDEADLEQRLRVGFVFDGGQLLNRLTVAENIALPLRYHRDLDKAECDAEVRRMVELTGLEPWTDSTPGTIPRNWQKRVGLARALMLKPDVLLVDNPLGGLDTRHRNWWLTFLDQLWQGHEGLGGRRTTVVVSTVDLRPWQGAHRRFAILKDHQLVILGSWEQAQKTGDDAVRELIFGAQPGV